MLKQLDNSWWRYSSFILLFILTGVGCQKWDDHIAVNQQNLNINLIEKINQLPQLSKFAHCLKITNLDQVINSDNSYTVWAPDNEAMKKVPAEVLNDTAQLKDLLLNLVSNGNYFIKNSDDTVRVPMLNGKRLFLYNGKLDSAQIVSSNIYVRNGVLQVIDKVVYPLPSIWEFIMKTKGSYLQNRYITALNYSSQDPNLATLDSINPTTGEPVYKPGTGIVTVNSFKKRIYDIANEDSLFTYVLLTNDLFRSKSNEVKTFFKSSNPAITDSNAYWTITKDLVVKGLYPQNQISKVLMSKFGLPLHINKENIEFSKRLSNGIVYVVNGLSYPLKEKIPVRIIQGENPYTFSDSSSQFKSKIFYRERLNDSTGENFIDIYLNLGSSGRGDYVDFITNGVFTLKYRVYWVALNDYTPSPVRDGPYGTREPLPQILKIGTYGDTLQNPLLNVQTDVEPYTYSEVYIGEFENNSYDLLLQQPVSPLDTQYQVITPATKVLRLMSPMDIPDGIPHNITVDYIKLVPEIK